MDRVKDMTRGNPARLILFFALPLMFGNIFQQLYTLVDSVIVGRFVGIAALAALGAADWPNWLILSSIIGFTHGFSILISQRFGANDIPGLRRIIAMSLLLAALIAAIYTAVCLPLVQPVLHLINTPENIIADSLIYLRIIYSSIFVLTAYNMFSAILRALGDSRTPLTAMIIAALLNIILDIVFVVFFNWGVAGAAAATVIAQFCASLFCLKFLLVLPVVKLQINDFRIDKNIFAHLFRLGLPLASQNIIIAVGGMIVQSVINGYGFIFVAGFTAVMKLYGMLELAAVAFGYAMATFTGQNIGAGLYKRIRRGMKAAQIMAAAVALFIGGIMLLLGKFIIRLFVSGEPAEVSAVVDIAYSYLFLMSIFLIVLYMLHLFRSALQGMGDTLIPMMSGLVEFCMRVAIVLILPIFLGRNGVYLAEIGAWTGAASILGIFYYLRVKRLFVGLARPEVNSDRIA